MVSCLLIHALVAVAAPADCVGASTRRVTDIRVISVPTGKCIIQCMSIIFFHMNAAEVSSSTFLPVERCLPSIEVNAQHVVTDAR